MALRFSQLWLCVVLLVAALANAQNEETPGLRRNRRAAADVIQILPEEHSRTRARGLKNEKSGKSMKTKSAKGEKEPKAHSSRGVDADIAEVFLAMSMSMSM